MKCYQPGDRISLIPIEEQYLDELSSFSLNPVIWEHIALEICSREDLQRWYQRTVEETTRGNVFPFLIQRNSNHEILGTTRIFDLDGANKKAEIGMTWINPVYWGSKINTEAKLLIMRFAFYTLRLNRVQFRADERNLRSLKAIAKLGATLEAKLRSFKQRRDGSIGDSYLYSIISSEWPEIEAKLMAHLHFE
jgi:N-acetyltransferase